MPLAIELAAPWLRTLTPRPAGRAPRRPVRAAHRGQQDRPAAAPDAARGRRLELASALGAGAGARPPPGRLPRRRHPHRGGTGVRGPGPSAAPPPAGRPGGSPALPRAGVLPALSGLVGKSMLTMSDTPGDCAPRYRMLETVRAYGLERLAEASEETATRDAFARYYLDFAETADPLLRSAAGPLVPRAAGRAGQRARRAPLGHRPTGRGHRAAVGARPWATTGSQRG